MQIQNNLLQKYNIPVPRYTSYPPANFFGEFESEKYLALIEKSNKIGEKNISIYIHIPFCKQLCFYCGCNMSVYKNEEIVANYFDALFREIEIILPLLDKSRKISQIHYGGGTPNSVSIDYIKKINNIFFQNFEKTKTCEVAIECHPAMLDENYIDGLVEAGFNRLSLGVQDTNKEVLQNVNRKPSILSLDELFRLIKQKKSDININLDLIYGLPGQSVDTFTKTVFEIVKLKPNRIVTFSYAHVPSIKPHQKVLESKGLPSPDEKALMFQKSREILLEAGYKAIGLDHYVLENDDLNIALQNHILHRNFQGYCTKETTGQVYAFGVSAISQLDSSYIQNSKDIEKYVSFLKSNKLASEKGLVLTHNQIIIKDIIDQLMSNYYLDLKNTYKKFDTNLDNLEEILGLDENTFSSFIEDNLMTYENGIIAISENGKFFIRNIVASLDPALKGEVGKTFSRSV